MERLDGKGGQLVLIRHAPTSEPTRLCGRTDVPAILDRAAIATVSASLVTPDRLISSPAERCVQTAAALWPGVGIETDDRLWEQDFGVHDALAYSDLPDLGVLSAADLADYAAPGGESFSDVCRRVHNPLADYAKAAWRDGETTVLVVHAGVIRAALAGVLQSVPAGLAFEVGNLSVTRLRAGPEGPISVMEVNRQCHANP